MGALVYCLDTSAVNRLADDAEQSLLFTGLTSTNHVYITAMNIIEACKTPDLSRRTSLLRLLGRLSNGVRPLTLPNDLLVRTAQAYQSGSGHVRISIESEDHIELWKIVRFPEQVTQEHIEEVIKWAEENEGGINRTHLEARPELQQSFRDGRSRPRSAVQLMKKHWETPDDLAKILTVSYRFATGFEVPQGETKQVLTDLPQWRIYFALWAHLIYRRAVQQSHHGKSTNAGMMDLLCAIYLESCDVFITNDIQQRRALRILSKVGSRKPRIQSYNDFRLRLLPSCLQPGS